MRPTMWDGSRWSNEKPNPVTLVSTVVARKTAVQPSRRFPAISPNTTTSPEPMPARLMMTWIAVNVARLKIMGELRSGVGLWIGNEARGGFELTEVRVPGVALDALGRGAARQVDLVHRHRHQHVELLFVTVADDDERRQPTERIAHVEPRAQDGAIVGDPENAVRRQGATAI